MPLLGKSNFSQGRTYVHKSGIVRVKSTPRQKAATKIQRAYRRRRTATKSAPRAFGKTPEKGVAAYVMKQNNELKIRTLANRYADQPKAQVPAGGGVNSVVQYQSYCLGSPADTWVGPTGTLASGFNPLLGYQYAPGVLTNQRVGKYMYLNQCSLGLQINMDNTAKTSCPMKFRVIVFKAIRNAQVGTTGGNPFDRLFLDTSGNEFGLNTLIAAEAAGMELMQAIPNRRNFKIYKDECFYLQNPFAVVQGSASIVSPHSCTYPTEKNITMTLRHNERTAFDGQNQPSDCNFQYCMVVMSTPAGTVDSLANNAWTSSVRGTVSAYDS